ncbi:unnamed protein product [Choristocarpus tenellus]
MFIFGEIDCREGILLAVEKGRYETVEQGMEETVSIFIKVAKALVKNRGFRAFIHPVIPVLNETRAIVKTYNRIFRRQVEATPCLHWLDFFDDMLTEDGMKLRPELELDGTHLSPAYLGLLEGTLRKAWPK